MAELTNDQALQVGEALKVINSFEYFCNRYVFIEDKANKRAMQLKLWPAQAEILPTITDSKLLIILKAQQLGLTWLTAAYVLWSAITNPMHLVIVISVTEDLSVEFLDRIYFILDRLPKFLQPKIKTRSKQVLEFLSPDGLISTIKSLPTTEMGGQSKTPNLLVMDETCKNRMASAIFNASYAGIEQAKGQIILISNSIKEGPGWAWTKDTYVSSMRGKNRFKRIFLSWRAHPERPENFKLLALAGGMSERECNERFPDTEEDAISDRNILGVYYSQQMKKAREDGRITRVPYSTGFEVYTFWDLGVDDSTSIWFMQHIGKEYRFIDYYENTGMGLAHYAKILKERGYVYGDHYMPHDAAVRELGGDTEYAISRKDTAENLGISPIIIVKRAKDTQSVMNGIESGRNILSQCCFDEKKCAMGIEGLESYRSEYDEERGVLSNKPLHNIASHPADSWRTFSVGYAPKKIEKVMSVSDYMDSIRSSNESASI
jgi:hypothetical protein